MSMGLMESILLELLGPQSLNLTKDLEEGTFTLSKMVWGLVYHTTHQELIQTITSTQTRESSLPFAPS